MAKLIFLPLCLLLCGSCGRARETAVLHIVHTGDVAVVVHGSAAEIPIAIAKSEAHALARAVESGDTKQVEAMIGAGRVLLLPARTRVRVTGESYNERRLEVLEGPHVGRTGWAPFEWLENQRT